MSVVTVGMDDERGSAAPDATMPDNPWVIAIKSELQNMTGARVKGGKVGTTSTIFRVRGQVRKVKAEHFEPELMYMGLFHNNRYVLDVTKNRGDKFRLEMTSAFLKIIGPNYDWEKLCSEVVDDPGNMQMQYGMDELDHRLVRCSLTLDAIFLVSYLIGYLFLQDLDADSKVKFPFSLEPFREVVSEEGVSFHNIVANDITKLENQIPLPLMRKVLEIMYRGQPSHFRSAEDVLNEMCYKFVKTISVSIPGFNDDPSTLGFSRSKVVNFAGTDHLLGCICSVMFGGHSPREMAMHGAAPHPESHWMSRNVIRKLSGLARRSALVGRLSSGCSWAWRKKKVTGTIISDENSLHKISLPSITKLYEAGIECRGEPRGYSHIDLVPRFKKKLIKGTLYISIFSILHRTELLWRNMVAYEAGTVKLGDHAISQFIYFLKFMDELIDTEQDVALLRRGRHPVIPKNLLGTEKDVAELFNKIAQHYTVVDARAPQWMELRGEIDKFYKQRYRRMVLEFVRYNFGKPWFVISLLAATILLALTILQTIYTMLAYYGI